MNCFEDRRELDNLRILRATHFFRIVDPKHQINFKLKVYRMVTLLFLVITNCTVFLGLVGLVLNSDFYKTFDYVGFFVVISAVFYCSMTAVKTVTVMLNAKDIWNLIDATDISHVRNSPCSKYVALYDQYRNKTVILSKALLGLTVFLFTLWCASPLLLNALYSVQSKTDVQRYENIYNFMYYGITLSDFNKYFYVFYTLEVMILAFCVYNTVVFNTLFICFSNVLMARFEINSLTFTDIGYNKPPENENKNDCSVYHDDFKAVMLEQQKVYFQMKKFYSIVRPAIILSVCLNSGVLVLLMVPLIQMFSTMETVSIFHIVKLLITSLFLCVDIFFYCYFLEKINEKRESVKFGIYSCNWTVMDLKFKKLVLLAMTLHDCMSLQIKITPLKIINLRLFSSVMTTCYNMISVLLKTIPRKENQMD